jgi:hypothetical protein
MGVLLCGSAENGSRRTGSSTTQSADFRTYQRIAQNRRVCARFAITHVACALAPEEKIVQVSKDSIDLGIVVTDEKAALGFYRDQLGLEWEGELPVPGGRMYRLKCGTTVIKLLKLNPTPEAKPAADGLRLIL